MNQLNLDLRWIANARGKGRRGGLEVLLARIRNELTERWQLRRGRDARSKDILLADFDGAEWAFDDAVQVHRVSALEGASPGLPAEFEREDAFDDIILSPQLAWLDADAAFAAATRALRPGGRLLFCTFGPDTLQQLRDAWAAADELPHVHPFADMHNIGDALLACGLTRPIVDADRVVVQYPNMELLHADLRAEGFVNVLAARRKTLTGKGRYGRYTDALRAMQNDGVLEVTFELVYGVAEKADGKMRVRFVASA